MLTMKGKYGLKAMIHLASAPEGRLTLSEEMATANTFSNKFLDAILGDLRNAGFAHARKGRNGGYRLSRPPAEIKVGHILRVLDRPLAPISCASRTVYRRCDNRKDEARCSVRLVMLEVRNAISSVLDEKSLVELKAMPAILTVSADELAASTQGRSTPARSAVRLRHRIARSFSGGRLDERQARHHRRRRRLRADSRGASASTA